MNTTFHITMLTKHILTITRLASSHFKHFIQHSSLSNLNLVLHIPRQVYHPSLFIHYTSHPPRSPLSALVHYLIPTTPLLTHHSYKTHYPSPAAPLHSLPLILHSLPSFLPPPSSHSPHITTWTLHAVRRPPHSLCIKFTQPHLGQP